MWSSAQLRSRAELPPPGPLPGGELAVIVKPELLHETRDFDVCFRPAGVCSFFIPVANFTKFVIFTNFKST